MFPLQHTHGGMDGDAIVFFSARTRPVGADRDRPRALDCKRPFDLFLLFLFALLLAAFTSAEDPEDSDSELESRFRPWASPTSDRIFHSTFVSFQASRSASPTGHPSRTRDITAFRVILSLVSYHDNDPAPCVMAIRRLTSA